MERWAFQTGVNTNLPQEELFARLVVDALETLAQPTALQLSGFAFAVGEKLARCRSARIAPDASTLAELKALYTILSEQRQMKFFNSYAALDYAGLFDLVADEPTKVGDSGHTPADVIAMVDVYNAVWNLHYRQFEIEPATALAEWNISDAYQTRAVRAVLFDITFDRLTHLCRAMVDSCLDLQNSDQPDRIKKTVNNKRNLMINILIHREEAKQLLDNRLAGQSLMAQAATLKGLADHLQKSSSRSFYKNDSGGLVVALPPEA